MNTAHGWTTWDPSSITVWEHLPSGLRCQLILQDMDGRELVPTGWEPLEESLPDDALRSISHLRIFVESAEFEVECGGKGDVGACRVEKIKGDNVTARWDVAEIKDGWQIQMKNTEIAFAPKETPLPDDIPSFILEEREQVLRSQTQGAWLLKEPLAAMEAVLAANTFMLTGTDLVATTSRHLFEESGKWKIQNWQAFLTALATAYIDPNLALIQCRTALRLLSLDGILAGERTSTGVQSDISNPPVAAFCLWKIFLLTGDDSVIAESFPLLLRWHDWWLNARDGNQNGLLNWGSISETGMPDHPLYKAAPSDDRTGVLRIDDIGLCSLWALDAFALMRMALHLNALDNATHLETELNEISSRANLLLWDSSDGIFRSRDWEGYFTDRESVTVFLAFAGSVPTRNQADRLVQHLDREFSVPFLIPTLGMNDTEFQDQLNWSGRVSPLLNFLICEGLRQFGFDDLAESITLSSLELLTRSWNNLHHVFESYNALTGQGDDISQDPLSPNGLLLGALGITMLIDAEPWNGLRMGNLRGVDMAINNFTFRGEKYDVASGPWGFSISRGDELWLDYDKPAILRNLSQTEHEISCGVKLPGGGPLRLRFHGYEPGERVNVKVNGNATSLFVNEKGVVDCSIDIGSANRGHCIWHRAA